MEMNGGITHQIYLWLLAGAATLISLLSGLIAVLLAWSIRVHIKIDEDFQERIARALERLEDRINGYIDKLGGKR